ncbi:hypothetical protein AC629_42200 [Bradyrhizobium sp. NAS80.1]|nr:hypothetical protein AC629_42200 [Bradyrhizobium sp. NAS80.1]
MNAFVQGVKTLFTGPDTSAQDKAAAEAKQEQQISLARQKQTEQQQAALADQQAGAAGRTPRGRRLLIASTGDAGVSSTLGPNG